MFTFNDVRYLPSSPSVLLYEKNRISFFITESVARVLKVNIGQPKWAHKTPVSYINVLVLSTLPKLHKEIYIKQYDITYNLKSKAKTS